MNEQSKQIIEFFDRDQPYFEFSNFSRHGFEIDGEYWPTVEHYYQAAKFKAKAQREQIRMAGTPREAKNLGRSLTPLRPDWHIIKEQIMLNALRRKFQNPELKQQLLATGSKTLLEASPSDHYWGAGKAGDGQNRLGILLMQVRCELHQEDEK